MKARIYTLDEIRKAEGEMEGVSQVKPFIRYKKGKAESVKGFTRKNPAGKMRPVENPYEIWKSPDGSWEWRVLKKYQSPDKEATNPYARWMCAVKSPYTFGSWEYGDTYVRDVRGSAVKVKGMEEEGQKAMLVTLDDLQKARTKGAKDIKKRKPRYPFGVRPEGEPIVLPKRARADIPKGRGGRVGRAPKAFSRWMDKWDVPQE